MLISGFDMRDDTATATNTTWRATADTKASRLDTNMCGGNETTSRDKINLKNQMHMHMSKIKVATNLSDSGRTKPIFYQMKAMVETINFAGSEANFDTNPEELRLKLIFT